MRQFGRIVGVLEKDRRLVIGVGQHGNAAFTASSHEIGRQGLLSVGMGRVSQVAGLADLPVLAELAGKVAAHRAHGEDSLRGKEVEQRLFLDGIDVQRSRLAVDDQIQRAIVVAAHAALAHPARLDGAEVLAGSALDVLFLEVFDQGGFLQHSERFHLGQMQLRYFNYNRRVHPISSPWRDDVLQPVRSMHVYNSE